MDTERVLEVGFTILNIRICDLMTVMFQYACVGPTITSGAKSKKHTEHIERTNQQNLQNPKTSKNSIKNAKMSAKSEHQKNHKKNI